jgi:hypothetical protein
VARDGRAVTRELLERGKAQDAAACGEACEYMGQKERTSGAFLDVARFAPPPDYSPAQVLAFLKKAGIKLIPDDELYVSNEQVSGACALGRARGAGG